VNKYDVGTIFLDSDNEQIEIIYIAPEIDTEGERWYFAKFYYKEDGNEKFWFDGINNHYLESLKIKEK